MADSAEGRGVSFPALTETHRAAGQGDARAAGRGRQSARLPHLHLEQRAGDDRDLHRHGVGRLRPQHAGARFPARRPLLGRRLVADGRRLRGGAEDQRRSGAIVASMPENLPEEHAAELLRRGIVPIHGIAEAIDAAEAAAFIGEAWAAGRSWQRRSRAARCGGTRRARRPVERPDEAEAKVACWPRPGCRCPPGERAANRRRGGGSRRRRSAFPWR